MQARDTEVSYEAYKKGLTYLGGSDAKSIATDIFADTFFYSNVATKIKNI